MNEMKIPVHWESGCILNLSYQSIHHIITCLKCQLKRVSKNRLDLA